MRTPTIFLAAAAVALSCSGPGQAADKDKDLIPTQLPKEQQDNLLRFLQKHDKPDRYIPQDAKVISNQPTNVEASNQAAQGKPIKQYTVQIVPHRPVPGEEEVKRADVYYYRPNPEKGKPGITVRHTVDLTTGDQVGQTEVYLNRHTPLSRDELDEAVTMARGKTPAVQALYTGRDRDTVRWEYLQLMVNRKTEASEPGDRVVRLVFTADAIENQASPAPVRVIVNLTKGTVEKDER